MDASRIGLVDADPGFSESTKILSEELLSSPIILPPQAKNANDYRVRTQASCLEAKVRSGYEPGIGDFIQAAKERRLVQQGAWRLQMNCMC